MPEKKQEEIDRSAELVELFYLKKGRNGLVPPESLRVRHEGKETWLKPGQSMKLPRGQAHNAIAVAEGEAHGAVLSLEKPKEEKK